MRSYAQICSFEVFFCRKKEKLSLIIGNNIIRISGRAGKWYTNIPINGYSKEEIKLDGNNELCELSFSKEKLYHPDQNIFDKKYKVRTHELQNELVYYSLSGNIDTPTGILITFPGVSNFDNVNYRLSAMTSLQEKLQDVLIIAFQDKEEFTEIICSTQAMVIQLNQLL